MNSRTLVLLACAIACTGVSQGQTAGSEAAPAEQKSGPEGSSPEAPGAGGSSSGVAAKTAPSAPAVPGDAFVIGPEDVLYIRVMHELDLTGPQEVRPDGMISLQLIGEVKAAGQTPAQLAAAIRTQLLQSMRNPEVSVQVTKVNSRKFTIQGEVNRPGTYTFATPITLLEAMVNGGGFRDFANVKKIYILRKGQKLPFNYKDVSHGKRMEQNVVVQNGDQIFVP